MAYGTNTSGNAGQVAIDRFAEMMIARMEQMKASDWKKRLDWRCIRICRSPAERGRP